MDRHALTAIAALLLLSFIPGCQNVEDNPTGEPKPVITSDHGIVITPWEYEQD